MNRVVRRPASAAAAVLVWGLPSSVLLGDAAGAGPEPDFNGDGFDDVVWFGFS